MKDNKLIAEFMGYNYDKCVASTDKSVTLQEQGEYFIPKYNSGEWVSESELEFHDSWNWLWPVLIKCKESVDYCSDNALEYHNIEDEMLSQLSIEDTYNAVVEFIKEYNK
jgi:hypothetical protein